MKVQGTWVAVLVTAYGERAMLAGPAGTYADTLALALRMRAAGLACVVRLV